jgi:16S rRNA (guanine966-N2)-methyltransferase
MKVKPSQVRIIGGKWRRRLLPVLDEEGFRPTPDRVRETLFNWLDPIIQDTRCCDLFAGTGVLGLEALSRGAKEVLFIEKNPKALAQLKQSIAKLSAAPAEVLQTNALEWLNKTAPKSFDVIFCDPPYALQIWDQCLQLVEQFNWLADEGLIYLEHPRNENPPNFAHWEIVKQSFAGNVVYYLLKKKHHAE